MSEDLIAAYRRWYRYEQAVHQQVIESFYSVPENQRSEPAYLKALSIFGHIVFARELWLFRMGAYETRPSEMFPALKSADELATFAQQADQQWSKYLETLDEQELQRVFEYQSTEGSSFRSQVVDILIHLYGHSLYHRGQIASLIKVSGGKPVETDFVFWSREELMK